MEAPVFDIAAIIIQLAEQHPFIASVVAVVGVLRIIFKPIMSVIEAYIAYTPDKGDDAKLEEVKSGKVYKAVAFVLDWFASVKLPVKK